MAIEQGLLERGGALGTAPTVEQRMTGSGESLIKTRSIEDLLGETNSLLRRIVCFIELSTGNPLVDPGND